MAPPLELLAGLPPDMILASALETFSLINLKSAVERREHGYWAPFLTHSNPQYWLLVWGKGSAEVHGQIAPSTPRKDLYILNMFGREYVYSEGRIFTFSSPAASAIDH